MAGEPLILNTDRGLYCPRGDFYVDAVEAGAAERRHPRPFRPRPPGFGAVPGGEGRRPPAPPAAGGRRRDRPGRVRAAAGPATASTSRSTRPGTCSGRRRCGSSTAARSWVVSGDYKRQPDPTCRPFETVRCDTFITECTFGLPIFRWDDPGRVRDDVNQWWRANRDLGRTSILLAYSLGKAQRVLAGLDAGIGPILLHGAVDAMTRAYREAGVALPEARHADAGQAKLHRGRAVVVAPPSAMNSTWARKFAPFSTGVASGWMRVRGFRRRRGADRGFVLSDHVDFPALLRTIDETGAAHVIATHGYTDALVRLMRERGRQSTAVETRFSGDEEEASARRPVPPRGQTAKRPTAPVTLAARARAAPMTLAARRRRAARKPARTRPPDRRGTGRVGREAVHRALLRVGRDHPHGREARGDAAVLPHRAAGRRGVGGVRPVGAEGRQVGVVPAAAGVGRRSVGAGALAGGPVLPRRGRFVRDDLAAGARRRPRPRRLPAGRADAARADGAAGQTALAPAAATAAGGRPGHVGAAGHRPAAGVPQAAGGRIPRGRVAATDGAGAGRRGGRGRRRRRPPPRRALDARRRDDARASSAGTTRPAPPTPASPTRSCSPTR